MALFKFLFDICLSIGFCNVPPETTTTSVPATPTPLPGGFPLLRYPPLYELDAYDSKTQMVTHTAVSQPLGLAVTWDVPRANSTFRMVRDFNTMTQYFADPKTGKCLSSS